MPSTDSLLNDYLDDRLDPAARRRLESALASDPRLALSLRALTEIRDLVAALPRKPSIDVAPRVLSRISAARPESNRHRIKTWRPSARLAIAASVLAIVGIALVQIRPRPGGRPVSNPSPSVAIANEVIPPPAFVAKPKAADIAQARSPAARLAADPATPGLAVVRRFIDNPSLHRVFSVSGSDDVDRRIASVVAQTTRYNYLRLSIAQGIVIDPRHPDQAAVYAVVVSDQDLDVLRDRLRAAVGEESVAEADVDPAVAVQLAEITVAQAFRPNPRADVVIPAGSLALRVDDPIPDGEPSPELAALGESDQPTPEQFRSAPVVAELEPAPAGPEPAAAQPSTASAKLARGSAPSTASRQPPIAASPANSPPLKIVLVWVAKSDRGG